MHSVTEFHLERSSDNECWTNGKLLDTSSCWVSRDLIILLPVGNLYVLWDLCDRATNAPLGMMQIASRLLWLPMVFVDGYMLCIVQG